MNLIVAGLKKLISTTVVICLFKFAYAQIAESNMPVTTGRVEAVIHHDNTLCLGGNFAGLGPRIPNGA